MEKNPAGEVSHETPPCRHKNNWWGRPKDQVAWSSVGISLCLTSIFCATLHANPPSEFLVALKVAKGFVCLCDCLKIICFKQYTDRITLEMENYTGVEMH